MVKFLVPLIGLGFSSFCFAQNPLSVHVLNLENGLPSTNVKVVLEAQQNDKWTEINTGTTDEQGRIAELYPKDAPLQKGVYKALLSHNFSQEEAQMSFLLFYGYFIG